MNQQKKDTENLLILLDGDGFRALSKGNSLDDLVELLAGYINRLLESDVAKLMSVLYRLDVSEEKLKMSLSSRDQSESCGHTIAWMIVERQRDKIIYRKIYNL